MVSEGRVHERSAQPFAAANAGHASGHDLGARRRRGRSLDVSHKTVSEQMSEEQWWVHALGAAPMRDFTSRVFTRKPAMVKKEPVNGHRMWTEYDPTRFSEEEYDLVPGMWDHEHCAICFAKIQEGDTYWQNSRRQILCPSCHEKFEKRG